MRQISQRGIKVFKEKFFYKFVKIFHKYAVKGALLPIWLIRIKNFKPSNLSELVDFSFTVGKGLIRPAQVREEILQLLMLLKKINLNYILEIGTDKGGTLFLFSKIASKNATIISVDLLGGEFRKGYPKWKVPLLTPLFKSFASSKQKICLIRANSHEKGTLEKVKSILGDRKLDFLFIDGDHTYEGVKKDFEMYSPLVKKGGVVALHDIVRHPSETGCEVSRFWDEIKFKYKYVEFVKSWDQNWAGIGLIKLK